MERIFIIDNFDSARIYYKLIVSEVYGTILLSIFFIVKRKTITLDSFATQIMAWLVSYFKIHSLV